ncbi:hypothetical protein [Emticicia sp. TH156]|uniref:hypothetical protein n=1 Tax=Emticicia sp. TH156 TaxID=2067454 RepID=UPI000C77CB61|nr:hypothetical protein [Emticicia sp. TH156]PLK46082.1 hypothetical protein C0V77_01665 [Emticicia sp. TH156]
MFTILSQAFNRTAMNWKMVLTVFILNLSLGLILATPLYNLLQSESHNSLEFEKLLNGFDFTVISDFMSQSRKTLRPFWLLSFALSVIYMILNIFFAGGILCQFAKRGSFSLAEFFKNSARYFGRFLLVFVFEILVLLVVAIVSFACMGVSLVASDGSTEPVQMAWLTPSLFISAFLLTVVLNMGQYAKIILFKNQSLSAWAGFLKAAGYVFNNFKTMRIYWAILIVAAALVLAYYFLESAIGLTSAFKIAIMFIVQQVFIFCRVFVKIWTLSGAFEYLSLKPALVTALPKENRGLKSETFDSGESKLSV